MTKKTCKRGARGEDVFWHLDFDSFHAKEILNIGKDGVFFLLLVLIFSEETLTRDYLSLLQGCISYEPLPFNLHTQNVLNE